MESKTKMDLLKDAVLKLKQDNVQQLSVDALLDYISKLESVAQEPAQPSAAQLEHYKAQLSAWVEKQKETSAINVEGFKSVILAGQNALRSAILLNGGAAVALLAYIGKLSVDASGHVRDFALPLLFFVSGALVIAVGAGVTYLTQWFYFGGGGWRWKVGFGLNILAMVLALASYGLFAAGALLAYRAFKGYA
jgi:hypothetical protein